MSRIAESEMILNARGAIYHLDMKPDEIGNTVFLVGDPGRVKEGSKHFENIEFNGAHRECITHTGLSCNKRLRVL